MLLTEMFAHCNLEDLKALFTLGGVSHTRFNPTRTCCSGAADFGWGHNQRLVAKEKKRWCLLPMQWQLMRGVALSPALAAETLLLALPAFWAHLRSINNLQTYNTKSDENWQCNLLCLNELETMVGTICRTALRRRKRFLLTMFTIHSFGGLSSGLEHVLKAKP